MNSTAWLMAWCSIAALACTDEPEAVPERVETGLLGCPRAESCVLVAVAQTVDERVEVFAARPSSDEAGPGYRGALDLDLQPSPEGDVDINLDEPRAVAWDGEELHLLVSHYPSAAVGSLLSMPAAGLADLAPGELLARARWFEQGASTGALGERLVSLGYLEVHGLLAHPGSDSLLMSVFANDLLLPPLEWQSPSVLLDLQPPTKGGEASVRVSELGCVGALDIVDLDEAGDAVALVCDGDERVVVLDTRALASGGAPSVRCSAGSGFSLKQVRQLAPDGLGGVVMVETPLTVSGTEVSRLWWFDGACELREDTELMGGLSWVINAIARVPGPEPRWLLGRGIGAERGLITLAGDVESGSIEPCGRVEGLDDAGAWTDVEGSELVPRAIALTEAGDGLAVSTGPQFFADAEAGYGSLWWMELEPGVDLCTDPNAASDPLELGASAPAVDPADPQTWRRAPDTIELIELHD